MRKIGTLKLGNKVDITDPCYDKGTWCRMTVDCEPGEYVGYVTEQDTDWGHRVAAISIFKADVYKTEDDMDAAIAMMNPIGDIGVDAGLAGFFNDKKDFDDDEWSDFCDRTYNGNAWKLYNGIFSSSGYGDGFYPVYATDDHTAFEIVFIDENGNYVCTDDEE